MDQVENDHQFDSVIFSRQSQEIQLRLVAINQSDPFFAVFRITPLGYLSNGQLQGWDFSPNQINQAWPGAPEQTK
ncbi:MAG: hypothetical protein KF868_17405 [Acidobacteria bacterium]|nr:hypothetical protein [Acidobacteriota bacterium]